MNHALIHTYKIIHQNDWQGALPILDSGHSCVPLEKLMAIDVLNINCSLLEAEISSSYCDGNGHYGHVANIPHLLDLHGNRLPTPRRPPVSDS